MGFTLTPNLPDGKVSKIIAGQAVLPYVDELNRLGMEVIFSDVNEKLKSSLKEHADLSVNYIKNGRFLLDSSQKPLSEKLIKLGYSADFITESVKEGYPHDCLLNATITSETAICNKNIIASKLKEFLINNNYRIINTNQGYSKCSVCVVDENAFITDDESIYNSLRSNKNDALLIGKGSIALKGYNYGFIGGCCGKLSKDILAFCGNIKLHSDYSNIKAFVNNYKINLISLSNNELEDIGGLIPIYENEV